MLESHQVMPLIEKFHNVMTNYE